MEFNSLSKPYTENTISNEDFAKGIGLHYWLDETSPESQDWYVYRKGQDPIKATVLEYGLWLELRHAYGFAIPQYGKHLQ